LNLNVRSGNVGRVPVRALDLVRDPEMAREISAHLVSLERLGETRGRRATGIAALDGLLGGGWPRAALSEISGRRSSGRTAVVRAALEAASAAGETAALVDVGGTLDARAAPAAPGPALLWIRCRAGEALKAVDLVVAAGGFGTVALDLCDARLKIPDAAWVRLRHAARAQGTTVLVASGARRLGAFAAAAIELGGAPAFATDGPPLFTGLGVRAERLRNGRTSSAPEPENQPPCVSLVFTSRS
jgi:recA bacterial DNA recombination protein